MSSTSLPDMHGAPPALDYSPWSGRVWPRLRIRLINTRNAFAREPPAFIFWAVLKHAARGIQAAGQRRRDEQIGSGVVLNTIHAAKGTEYDHVLVCGDWSGTQRAQAEEERRVLYVGMTRARHTLSIFHRSDAPNPFVPELTGPCFHPRRAATSGSAGEALLFNYDLLGMADMYLDYAGRYETTHPIHAELAGLPYGAELRLESRDGRLALLGPHGVPVSILSAAAAGVWSGRLVDVVSVRLLGLIERLSEDCEEESYRVHHRAAQWFVPFCEVVWRRSFRAGGQPG